MSNIKSLDFQEITENERKYIRLQDADRVTDTDASGDVDGKVGPKSSVDAYLPERASNVLDKAKMDIDNTLRQLRRDITTGNGQVPGGDANKSSPSKRDIAVCFFGHLAWSALDFMFLRDARVQFPLYPLFVL